MWRLAARVTAIKKGTSRIIYIRELSALVEDERARRGEKGQRSEGLQRANRDGGKRGW